MSSPTKLLTIFSPPRTPTRRVLQDIGNISTPPSPRRRIFQDKENYGSPPPSPRRAQIAKIERELHHALQESVKKDEHIDWLEVQYSNLENEHNSLEEHSRFLSPEKLDRALHDNARLNTYIAHLEQVTSKNVDQQSKLETESVQRRNEISQLRRELKDYSRHLETMESEKEESVKEIGRLKAKLEVLEVRIASLLEQQAHDQQKRDRLHIVVQDASLVFKEKDKRHDQDKDEIEKLKNENAFLGTRVTVEQAQAADNTDLDKKLEIMTKNMDSLHSMLCSARNDAANEKRKNTELVWKLKSALDRCRALQGGLDAVETRLKEAREMQQQGAGLCMMMRNNPDYNYKVVAGDHHEVEHPTPFSPGLASPPAVGSIQSWVGSSNLLAYISRFLPRFTIEKMRDVDSKTLMVDTSTREDDEFEDIMDYESSEAEAETETETEKPRQGLDKNHAWNFNPRLPPSESGDGQFQQSRVHTKEKGYEEGISRSLDHSGGEKEDKFRGFLHEHF